MDKPVIPVVFATNDNFTLFCYIAVYSLIRNTSSSNFYKIYILETDLCEDNRRMLEGLTRENASVKCVDISGFTEHVELKGSLHLSQETYYRLFIPLIFPEYEKILYLDADMCVLEDVAQLYEAQVGDYPVGAVCDVICHILQAHSESIGLSDVRKTFNAGVLLINTVQFEKQKIREKCLALLSEDYQRKERKLIFADQDALQIVLYENHYRLDGKWNYQPQYLWRVEEIMDDVREEYVRAADKAAILHYSGDRKPWDNPELPKADVYFKWVKEADVVEKLITKLMAGIHKIEKNLRSFDFFRFPYSQVPYNSKIVIYAAGRVGTAFYHQLKASKYARMVLWVDKNWEKMDPDLGVRAVEEIGNTDFDYVIIGIESAKIAEDVKKMLMEMKVPQEKIVWEDYRFL